MTNENVENVEVNYFHYCNLCKHMELEGYKEPCNECLSNPYATNSEKPIKFDPKNA